MRALAEPGTEIRSEPKLGLRERSERWQGAFLVLLLVVAAWQGFAALTTPAARHRLTPVLDMSSFLEGRTAATVNFIEAHYLPADHILRAAGGILRWGAFRSGGPQVSVGCDDWLYLIEEAQTFPNAAENLARRADLTARIATMLQGRGIDFVVTVVPDKARIEAGTLCGTPRSDEVDRRYISFVDMLRAKGVRVVDLVQPLSEAAKTGPVFYRTDTHWNQRGAALAAKAVASGVQTPLDAGFSYRTDAETAVTDGPGDLLRLMSLDLVPDVIPGLGLKLRPAPDRQHLEKTVEVERPPPSDDLLAAGPGDQVVLLGSSFSLNGNFQGRLQEALGAPVNNVAEAGGGFAGSASAYLSGTGLNDQPPRLIIWEMPERTLSKPIEANDRVLADVK